MKKTIILTLFLGLLILLVMGLFSCTSVKLLDEKKQMTSEKSTSEEPLGKETIREEVISEEVISEEVIAEPSVKEQETIDSEPIKSIEEIKPKIVVNAVLTQPINTSVIVNVDIKSFSFKPNSITITVGDIVNWTNYDSTRHTVTSDDDLFNSKLLAQEKSWSYKFEKSGEYGYYCQPHPSMKGKVIVK